MTVTSPTSPQFAERRHQVGDSSIRLLAAGPPDGAPVLFLHGWPECADAWREVMVRAAEAGRRALAIDLPGIGGSTGDATDGSTRALADLVAALIRDLGLTGLTVVGHDLGGMVTYPMLRRHPELVDRAVIMDVVIPGVPPWQQVLANPYVWHFAFHSIPDLPQILVTGRERPYFDFFYDALGPPGGGGVSAAARERYVQAYRRPEALRAGFAWYRQLHRDAHDNQADATANGGTVSGVPLLYLRGEYETGELTDYLTGFGAAGLSDVRGGIVERAGHFAAEDNPEAVWRLISDFESEVSSDAASRSRSS